MIAWKPEGPFYVLFADKSVSVHMHAQPSWAKLYEACKIG